MATNNKHIKNRILIGVDPITLKTVRKATPNAKSDRERFDMLWKYNLIRVDFIVGEKFEDRTKRQKERKEFNMMRKNRFEIP